MLNKPKLLFPTYPHPSEEQIGLVGATKIANRVLGENGMGDFRTSEDNAFEWNGFYIFQYRNLESPEVVTGGGAALVARKCDNLAGMVYCSHNWLEQNADMLFQNISEAYAEHALNER